MSAPLSEQQRAEVRALLDGAPAATGDFIMSIAEGYRDRRAHEHPKHNEDWFCMNLAGWLGDRMPVVLSRLVDAEARVAELEAERHSTNEQLDDAVTALRERDDRLTELEERPLAWAERLDLKSLDNLLASIERAAGHEPITGAVDQIHEVLTGFRAAADALAEVRSTAGSGESR